jgi:hypothetical protein
LKFIILVARSIPFKNFDWLCENVDFKVITSGIFWPTLPLPLHLNGDLPLYHWISASLIYGLAKITIVEVIMLF